MGESEMDGKERRLMPADWWICPTCKHILDYDPYFGKWMCQECGMVFDGES